MLFSTGNLAVHIQGKLVETQEHHLAWQASPGNQLLLPSAFVDEKKQKQIHAPYGSSRSELQSEAIHKHVFLLDSARVPVSNQVYESRGYLELLRCGGVVFLWLSADSALTSLHCSWRLFDPFAEKHAGVKI